MTGFFSTGLVHVNFWEGLLVVAVFSHLSMLGVTLYLHRHQAHRALELHPAVSHFFRLWLWLTAGVRTRDFVVTHRRHHATSDTEHDPHSPHNIGAVWLMPFGAIRRWRPDANTVARHGGGTPADWIERNVYGRLQRLGLPLMLAIDIILFGPGTGLLIFFAHFLWLPVWVWGFITSYGHYIGYRNFAASDASRNVFPWGVLIGGEELHNNHHAHPTSAKFSARWFEFDIGWAWICVLARLSLAKVNRTMPCLQLPVEGAVQATSDLLPRVCCHRHEVLFRFAEASRPAIRGALPSGRQDVEARVTWLAGTGDPRVTRLAGEFQRLRASSPVWDQLVSLRDTLTEVWGDPSASAPQSEARLAHWLASAQASGIPGIARFADQLSRAIPHGEALPASLPSFPSA